MLKGRSILLTILFSLLLCLSIHTASFAEQVLSITPLTNTKNDQAYSWISVAMSDMITTDMAALNKVKIVQRTELNKILKEQNLQLSGSVDPSTAVKIGSLVGANITLIGDFIVLDSENIRFNANIYDVEKGTSIGAATTTGKVNDMLKLEKILVAKLFESLNIALSDEDKVNLYQMPTNSIAAIENNYRGVIALDMNKKAEAKTYFAKAVQIDPQYTAAKNNLELVLSGDSMFAEAITQVDSKVQQINTIESLYEFAVKNIYTISFEKPEIITHPDKNTADVKIKVIPTYNYDVVNKMKDVLGNLNQGDKDITFSYKDFPDASPKSIKAKCYAESFKIITDFSCKYYYNIENTDYLFQFYYSPSTDKDTLTLVWRVVFTLYDSDNKPIKDFPAILGKGKISYYGDPKGITVMPNSKAFNNVKDIYSLYFLNIPIDRIKTLSKVQITKREYFYNKEWHSF